MFFIVCANEVIVRFKGNQKTLLNNCKDTCELRLPCSEYTEPLVKERNRIESRKVTVFEDILITDKKMGGCLCNYKSGKEKRDI